MNLITSRRGMLIGLAATSSAAIPAVALAQTQSAEEFPPENAELVKAWRDFRTAENEYYAAKDELSWLVAEWKHLWPLAPEEILGGANAHHFSEGSIERDIAGRALERDVTVLTTRLSKKFREKGGTTCFYIDQPNEIAETLTDVKMRAVKGRTAKAVARKRKQQAACVARLETRHRLATEYLAEITRLRELSGVSGVKERITVADDRLTKAAATVSKLPAATLVGVRLKADAMVGTYEYLGIKMGNFSFIGDGLRLAEAVMEVTTHLAGCVAKGGVS